MSLQITITEEEILGTPNNYSLGEKIRNKFFEAQRNLRGLPLDDDESFIMEINPDGSVKRIVRPWVCGICGKDTSTIEHDYLVGYDHLSCVISGDPKMDEYDRCIICGNETPYLRSTNINERIGYVEGAGQSCFQPNICDKV